MEVTLPRRAALAGLAATLVPLGPGRASDPGSTLEARPLEARVDPSTGAASLWSLASSIEPPVLRLKHGEELRLRLKNGLPKPLSLHLQGMRGPADQDGVGGVSRAPIPPGGEGEIRLTPPDPGTILLRPLVVGGASELAGRGIGGMLIVEEKNAPPVDGDYALLLRDWRTEPSGQLAPFGSREEAALAGRLGTRLTVGGHSAPHRITMPPGSRVRLRLANGCNARIMRIRFDGMKAFVAAVDGQPTDTFEPLRANLPFAPGSRYDIFFDLPAEAGATCSVSALVGAGLPMLEFVSQGSAVGGRSDVAALPANAKLPPEIKLQNALRPELVIAGGARPGDGGRPVLPAAGAPVWTINGRPGSPDGPPLFTARRGQPVVLALTNQTAFPQPLHLHGHVLRLLHPLDDGWEPYWLDTIQIPEGRTLRAAFMADNPGRWTLSSTVLERFDAGLWCTFAVS